MQNVCWMFLWWLYRKIDYYLLKRASTFFDIALSKMNALYIHSDNQMYSQCLISSVSFVMLSINLLISLWHFQLLYKDVGSVRIDTVKTISCEGQCIQYLIKLISPNILIYLMNQFSLTRRFKVVLRWFTGFRYNLATNIILLLLLLLLQRIAGSG